MELFEIGKKTALTKDDKSKIGEIDKEIKHIVDHINSLDNYYTTSSCSGRIVLLKEPKNSKKSLFEWLYVSHAEGNEDKLKEKITELKSNDEFPEEIVRIRSEPFILHICCRTMEDADTLLNISFDSGLKKSGIIMIKKRIMLSITGSNFLDTPIAKDKKLFPDEEYMDFLIKTSEKKLIDNHKQMNRFYDELKKAFGS